MSDKERMLELIDVFCDADKRGLMTQKEMDYCPTIQDVMGKMA